MTLHSGVCTAITTRQPLSGLVRTPATTFPLPTLSQRNCARCSLGARHQGFRSRCSSPLMRPSFPVSCTLAGFYPSVYLGAPWWFLDSPDTMLRFRAAVTETAGFSRSSGFIDDTRAFCSMQPATMLHGGSRLGSALALGGRAPRLRERARQIIVDIVDAAPRRAFKL